MSVQSPTHVDPIDHNPPASTRERVAFWREPTAIAASVAALGLGLSMQSSAESTWSSLMAASLGLVAAVALVFAIDGQSKFSTGRMSRRRRAALVYFPMLAYWLVQLQGLRHAHPAMFLAFLAMAGYLAIYPVMFIWMSRRLRRWFPIIAAAPLAWVATEVIRNYFATGISIGMLGHTWVGLPRVNWVASLGGTYAVSMLMMVTAAAIEQTYRSGRWIDAAGIIPVALIAAIGSPSTDSATPQSAGELANVPPTVALVQRDEAVVYGHSVGREMAIFDAYVRQTIQSIGEHQATVDVVVWPESMLTGAVPWMIAEPEMIPPADAEISPAEFAAAIESQRQYFEARAREFQNRIASVNNGVQPILVGGCGVVRYAERPYQYSGIVSVNESGKVSQWYGKRHLVMFGEYIPLIGSIPGLRNLIPPGLGVSVGENTSPLRIGKSSWLPTICIETAVERVACRAVATAIQNGQSVDAIVTVTNDGWFDHSTVVSHHRRAARMVAVASGRPILSSANGGPTMVINCNGGIEKSLPYHANSTLIASTPSQTRHTIYTQVGDWPWWLITAAVGVMSLIGRGRDPKSLDSVEPR